ncbi:MAG: MFS transporter [Pseudanabaenaceae cyanobacterium]
MEFPSTGILPLLRNRNFMVLWVSQLITQLADKILFVLQILIATSRQFTDYPQPQFSYESLVMIASTLPAILFGTLAGIYVDRHDKFRVMIYTNIVRATFVFLLPIFPNSFFYLLFITFAEQIFTQFFAPAEQSAIPLVVDKPNLMAANSLIASSIMASLIIGFGIGSPLLNSLTDLFPDWSRFIRELFVGGCYLLSSLMLWLIPVREEIDPEVRDNHMLRDLKESLVYIKHNPPVWGAIVQLMLLYGVLGVLLKLSMNLSKLLIGNQGDFGFFVSGTGVGVTISALLLGQFSNYFAHRPLPWIGYIGIGFSLFLFAFAPTVSTGIVIAVLLGLHTALILIPMQTVIHHYTDDNMRGKVFGLLNNGQNIAVNVPLIIVTIITEAVTALLGEQLGFQLVVIGCALLVIGLGRLIWQTNRSALEKVL